MRPSRINLTPHLIILMLLCISLSLMADAPPPPLPNPVHSELESDFEWILFCQHYRGSIYASIRAQEDPSPENLAELQWAKQRERTLDKLPTGKAWAIFMDAAGELESNGNRPAAARLFRRIATEYPQTHYAAQAREIADRLDKMIIKDRQQQWKKPFDDLTLKEQIQFHIFYLRDATAEGPDNPFDHARFIGPRLSRIADPANEPAYEAATELQKCGKPAVPFLIDLLEDRRPTRGVLRSRRGPPTWAVLRYQDVAFQILCQIYDVPLRENVGVIWSSVYVSTMSPEDRRQVVEWFRKKLREE